MMDTRSSWEQLKLLQYSTKATNSLHEAQVLQLRLWPLVAYPFAVSSEAAWDPENRSVEFKIGVKVTLAELQELKELHRSGEVEKRMQVLDRSVKDMLGSDVTVIVKIKDTLVFASGADNSLKKQ